MDDCYLCKPNPELDKQIQKSATRNAHQLAIKQANRGLAGLTWCEVQTAFFPKIFAHEKDRQTEFLREKDLDKRLSEYKGQDICCYHSESLSWFSSGFHQEVFQKTLDKFLTSKWPRKAAY